MARKIQVKRGNQSDLPTLAVGELGFTVDENRTYIGSQGGNVELETAAGAQAKVNSHANNTAVHVTSTEKNTWNNKASTATATITTNGLMSSVDKGRLDSSYDLIGDHVVDPDIHLSLTHRAALVELTNSEVSGWTTATLLNGWSTSFDRTPRFRRVGNMVQLSGGVGGGTTGDGTSVFVLPVGMRPSRTVVVPIIAAGTGAILNGNALINRLVVTTGGNVTFSYGWQPEGWAIDVMIPL